MERTKLKYGCNPHQPYAAIEALSDGRSPVAIRNGNPSMINLLDALNAWQLVSELRGALELPLPHRSNTSRRREPPSRSTCRAIFSNRTK